MGQLKPASNRGFTEASLAAGLEARRKKAAERAADPQAANRPQVFVVRSPLGDRGFGWEIRKFGGVVVDRSLVGYASAGEAQNAGFVALALNGAEESGAYVCGPRGGWATRWGFPEPLKASPPHSFESCGSASPSSPTQPTSAFVPTSRSHR